MWISTTEIITWKRNIKIRIWNRIVIVGGKHINIKQLKKKGTPAATVHAVWIKKNTSSSGMLFSGMRHMNSHTCILNNTTGNVFKGVFVDAKVFLCFLSLKKMAPLNKRQRHTEITTQSRLFGWKEITHMWFLYGDLIWGRYRVYKAKKRLAWCHSFNSNDFRSWRTVKTLLPGECLECAYSEFLICVRAIAFRCSRSNI